MECSDGAHSIGTRGCHLQGELTGKTKPDDAYRSAAHERLRREPIDVRHSIARHRVRRQRFPELGETLLRTLVGGVRLEIKEGWPGDAVENVGSEDYVTALCDPLRLLGEFRSKAEPVGKVDDCWEAEREGFPGLRTGEECVYYTVRSPDLVIFFDCAHALYLPLIVVCKFKGVDI